MALDNAKKECILEGAVRAFRRLGFRKTSIDDVAQEAKVGKGTVYMAVKSKDELYLRAVEREVGAWVSENASHAGNFGDSDIAAFLQLEVASARARDLVHPVLTGRLGDTVDAADVEGLRGAARQNLRATIQTGIAAGRYRSDLDPDLAARALQALEIALLTATGPHPDLLAQLVKMLVSGFRNA